MAEIKILCHIFLFDTEHRLKTNFISLITAGNHIKFGRPPWGGRTGAARDRAAASSIARKLLPCPLPRGWGRGDKPPQTRRITNVAPLGAEGSEARARGQIMCGYSRNRSPDRPTGRAGFVCRQRLPPHNKCCPLGGRRERGTSEGTNNVRL